MTSPPAQPKVYHITHIDNLPAIVGDGGLISDGEMIRRGGPTQAIGMSTIKRRRVEDLEVPCRPGTKVGDYVPFYFCPRSIMLYVIYCRNHPGLAYRGGQGPIVHLEADLERVIEWAESKGRPWAFSLSNAGTRYAEFRSRLEDLDQLDWTAIAGTDFRHAEVKEGKQAEFLVHERFPFDLVDRVGVQSPAVEARVKEILADTRPRPQIDVRAAWYF